MPRNPNKEVVEAHFDPNDPKDKTWAKFLELVKKKEWSKKKTAEWVITEYFKGKKG